MFATVLKEITGYFDRRALLSSFLPTLVAAGVLVVAVVWSALDPRVAVRLWDALPGVVQALLIVGFLVVVALWSFALVNLRPVADQVFQGRWGESAPLTALARVRTARHRDARARDLRADERLELHEAALLQAVESLPRPGEPGEPFDGDSAAELEAVERAWADAAALPSERASAILPGLSARLAALAATGAPELDDPRFARLVATATRLAGRFLQDVRSRRAAVQQRLFVLYPDDPVDVVPTAIGNILLAAEQHPRLRYGLDPVVIWSRLQPLLPDPFAAALKDAKASLDLMLTLTAYLIAVGIPVAVLAAVSAPLGPGALAWSCLAAVLVIIPALVRLRRPLVVAAPAAALLSLPVVLFSLTTPPALVPVLRSCVGVVLVAAVLVLAMVVHAGAKEAALAFSDQFKSAFDLHRRLVLHELGLEPPANLAAEQALWLDVCQFLYRGDPPVSPEFRYRPHVT
ncbi:hypothetical protein [Nonomuraea endophytica]|uniref:Uncharacterized protein n=1 Tax=Nonomuraea endophytica TaxID=714136 RepID=A0A7W8A2I5_9ACTN|nr:hypothetical protein [Nonomuraea endophytica]MBB5078382.1 hypothetical protein [Nonomuraea endophytica]